MGTRSMIGRENEDGTVEAVYCHWDGYPSHNGRILLENYTTFEKTNKLLELGQISSLGKTIEETTFYCRDRGEKLSPATLFENKEKANLEEYCYIMKGNRWFWATFGKNFAVLTKEDCL